MCCKECKVGEKTEMKGYISVTHEICNNNECECHKIAEKKHKLAMIGLEIGEDLSEEIRWKLERDVERKYEEITGNDFGFVLSIVEQDRIKNIVYGIIADNLMPANT